MSERKHQKISYANHNVLLLNLVSKETAEAMIMIVDNVNNDALNTNIKIYSNNFFE